jgi:hypothetical protein
MMEEKPKTVYVVVIGQYIEKQTFEKATDASAAEATKVNVHINKGNCKQ